MQMSNETCGACEPPPDTILRIPPPPLPDFLVHTSSNYYTEVVRNETTGPKTDNAGGELIATSCKYSCGSSTGSSEWHGINDEGGSHHHGEIPQQGASVVLSFSGGRKSFPFVHRRWLFLPGCLSLSLSPSGKKIEAFKAGAGGGKKNMFKRTVNY